MGVIIGKKKTVAEPGSSYIADTKPEDSAKVARIVQPNFSLPKYSPVINTPQEDKGF